MIRDLLTEENILDYLMTSDFNEGFTEEESKFLLLKYRYHYRVVYSKNEQLRDVVSNLSDKLSEKDLDIDSYKKRISNLESDLYNEKNRKLSIKERFFGKKINK